MIACLSGKLLFADPVAMTCVVDCAGVGYLVSVTANTLSKLPPASEDGTSVVRLFTHMQISTQTTSADVTLYGFLDQREISFFRLLITVQGVGPKAAMALLSLYDPDSLAKIIANEDVRSISKASGIGSKTAARIVLELAEKVEKLFPTLAGAASSASVAGVTSKGTRRTQRGASSAAVSDARDALMVLGYSQAAVNTALAECDPTLPTDDLIRAALVVLSSK